jgi:hypothetical protein
MALGFAPAVLAGLTGSALIPPLMFVFLVAMTILMWSSLVRSGEERMLKLH